MRLRFSSGEEEALRKLTISPARTISCSRSRKASCILSSCTLASRLIVCMIPSVQTSANVHSTWMGLTDASSSRCFVPVFDAVRRCRRIWAVPSRTSLLRLSDKARSGVGFYVQAYPNLWLLRQSLTSYTPPSLRPFESLVAQHPVEHHLRSH